MTSIDPTTSPAAASPRAETWSSGPTARATGPDVLLLAGLSDPAEAWEFQLQGLAERYRLTAFDNRGAGRSPQMPEGFTVADMADDAAAMLRASGVERAHVIGFSGGSVNAQELALRHPDLVRSLVLSQYLGPARRLLEQRPRLRAGWPRRPPASGR